MESSILSEGHNTSILRTGLSVAPSLILSACYPASRLTPPRAAGPERSDFVLWLSLHVPRPTGKGMSGRRPVVKGLVEALRTYRVRSCLRPVGAGNECPAGPDAGPHGSSPNQQNALVMAPALFLGLPSRSVGSHRFVVALDADRLAAKPRSC